MLCVHSRRDGPANRSAEWKTSVNDINRASIAGNRARRLHAAGQEAHAP
jgi:hypothetical protein